MTVQSLFQDPSPDVGLETLIDRRKKFTLAATSAIRFFDGMNKDLVEWKKAVFRCEKEFRPAEEDQFKQAFAAWEALAGLLVEKEENIRLAQNHAWLPIDIFAGIEHRKAQAVKILNEWVTPGPSIAPALRTRRLSPEGEAKLIGILEQRGIDI